MESQGTGVKGGFPFITFLPLLNFQQLKCIIYSKKEVIFLKLSLFIELQILLASNTAEKNLKSVNFLFS